MLFPRVYLLLFSAAMTGFAAPLLFTTGAQDDIFLAGGNTFTSGGGGIGVAPTGYAVLGGKTVTFSGVTGSWSCCSGGGTFNGPDGGPFATGSTDLNPTDGKIAGILDSSHTMFLVGVFLGSSLPVVQPSRLDFSPTGLTESFTTLSPGLGQVFYIGDGLTGTGSGNTQSFTAPAGSAMLFLGVADAFNFHGLPGFYADNLGSVSGTLNVGAAAIPEPAYGGLASAALLGLALYKVRKARRRSGPQAASA